MRIEESDLLAIPDLRTFRIIPWEMDGEKTAIMFCDIQRPDGNPYEGDPRWILRRMLDRIERKGWTFYVGPELEYFYFNSETDPEVLDQDGYFDYGPADIGTQLRKKTSSALEIMGIQVECSHHEVAPSQQEIDLKYREALIMADFVQIFKFTVKEMARESEVYASFIPKPIFGENGSGMHIHMSIFKGDTNLFYDKDAPNLLSATAHHFIAGVLRHIREITLVLNQWVNSYKRLVVGYEAPVYLSWGTRNRSSLIRVPIFKAGHDKSARMELRSPDPACNPYLAFAAVLAAGLEGIEKEYVYPEAIEENIFEMDAGQRQAMKIDSLPDSLENAIKEMAGSELMRKTLGDHVFNTLLANKRVEWEAYRMAITDYEIGKYLPFL